MTTADHHEIIDHSNKFDALPTEPTTHADALVARVKELLHEGNVQRIAVKNADGHTVFEIPVTAGVVAAVIAPALTAVAAVVALAGKWEIDVHRDDVTTG